VDPLAFIATTVVILKIMLHKIYRNLSVPCKSFNLHHNDVIVYVGFVFVIMVFTEEDELVISKRNQTLWSKTFSVAVPYKAVVRFIKS